MKQNIIDDQKIKQQIIHIEVGNRPNIAKWLDEEPHTELLCGATEGDSIWDDIGCIEIFGGYPAACTCHKCKKVAQAIRNGINLKKARESL